MKVRGNILKGEERFINVPTASELAKSIGLKNLSQVKELTGVSTQTLTNWHNNKPKLFKAVLLGCYIQTGGANKKGS